MKKLSLLLSAIMICTVGCSKLAKHDTPDAEKSVKATARYLNYNNWNEPEYMDPGLMSGVYESAIARNLFEGLTHNDAKTSMPVPAGAKNWDLSEDGRVYTFHLHEDAVWTDGKPVTAHDYVYAWTRNLAPKTASKYAFSLYYIKNGHAFNTGTMKDPTQLGVRALDNYTLQATLESPTPFFPHWLARPSYFPAPRWAIEAYAEQWTRPEHIVSNGPFMMQRWAPQQEMLLVKSPSYWGAAQVHLDGVRFLPIEDKETALKMYEAGEIDFNSELPEMKVASLSKHADYHSLEWLGTYYYTFNTTKPPFNDLRVRRALAMAIDRDTLVNKYLQGIHTVANQMVPRGMGEYHSPVGVTFQPDEARALLTAAGFGSKHPFPRIEVLYNTSEHHKIVAQVVQQMWKKHLGIEVALRNEEWKSYMKSKAMGQFDVSREGWIGDYADPNTFLEIYLSDSQQNFARWKSPPYDALIASAMKEQRAATRFDILQRAEAVLLEEVPIVPIYTYRKHLLVKPYVKGIYTNMQDIHYLAGVTIAQ